MGGEEEKPKVAISAKLVKELRDQSGAGMMDCKKALAECGGDVEKAEEYLRKKGITSAEKKASRVASEGMVSSYIHAGSRIGVLVEVNSETDFVARGDVFKELVQGIAMQIAASPSVEYVAAADAPAKIVNERALLEQAWIMDNNKTVGDAITEAIASIGENIKVRRFSRYVLGEGIEKKQENFADEVAAQTQAKESKPEAVAEEVAPKEEEKPKEEEEEKPKVAISAKLVKELRDQSGAGMMDCKKALAECGGDVAKAEEYLRMKGITSAAKKSSRVAAEGMV